MSALTIQDMPLAPCLPPPRPASPCQPVVQLWAQLFAIKAERQQQLQAMQQQLAQGASRRHLANTGETMGPVGFGGGAKQRSAEI